MKSLGRIGLMLLTAVLICAGSAGQALAASSVANNKKYKPKDVKIEYREFTVRNDDKVSTKMANIFAVWTNGSSSSDKIVSVFLGEDEVYSAEVASSLSCCSIRNAVLDSGPGNYKVAVYAKRTGQGDDDMYVVSSKTYKVTQTRYDRLDCFEPDRFMVEQPWLSYNNETKHVIAHWDEYPDVKKRSICIKKGDTAVSAWKSVSTDSADISDTIAAKGSGSYSVGVYSAALGEEYAVYSESLEITAVQAREIKQQAAAEQAAIEAGRIGWFNNRGVAWYYYKDYGVKAKNEWLVIDGKTYYFTSSYIMQTGWQVIDDRYYYFGKDGSLQRNITSPEGYKVNGDGVRVDDKGNVISAKGQKKLPSGITVLKTCSIAVSETAENAGTVKQAAFKDGSGYSVKEVFWEQPYEQWQPGQPVKARLVIETKPNYYFDSAAKFSVRGRSAVSSGNSVKRTVQFWYYPRMQLKEPSYLYVDNEAVLHWKKTDRAGLYKIVLESEDYDSPVKEDVKDTSFDLNGYISNDPVGVKLKIYAVHSANSKANTYITSSPVVEIDNINSFAKENTIDGTVSWPGSRMKYLDGDGNPYSGWAQLFGNWYFFDSKGYAHAPGWLKHIDGSWYYFDSEFRMCTGIITDESGKTYFLNDGSNKGVPLGAWVK